MAEPAAVFVNDWLRSVPASAACLAREVCNRLVPALESRGFSWQVGRFDTEACASNEIALERWCAEHVEFVLISFEPEWTQRFAISFGRFAIADPCRQDRLGYLAPAFGVTDRWWGKPEWVPATAWSACRAATNVATACDELKQVLGYIDGGAAGPLIRV